MAHVFIMVSNFLLLTAFSWLPGIVFSRKFGTAAKLYSLSGLWREEMPIVYSLSTHLFILVQKVLRILMGVLEWKGLT